MFETPSVLRESLPSYSAKPGAFYAPRALRWTTPPRGRTDPFQGPKIKPMFRRCSMLFQDDLGVENGGQNEVKIEPKSLPRRSWSRVAGRWGFLMLWGAFWAPLEPRNSCSRHNAGSISANLADRAGGSKIDPNLVQNLGQKPPRPPEMESKAVSKRAAMSVPISIRCS